MHILSTSSHAIYVSAIALAFANAVGVEDDVSTCGYRMDDDEHDSKYGVWLSIAVYTLLHCTHHAVLASSSAVLCGAHVRTFTYSICKYGAEN